MLSRTLNKKLELQENLLFLRLVYIFLRYTKNCNFQNAEVYKNIN